MKCFKRMIIAILTAMLLLCGCDYSSYDSGSSVTTTQTEPPRKVRCEITVNYDESLGEYLFGNSEKFTIFLDGDELGTVSASSDSKPIVKEMYLEEGSHKVTAKSSKEKLIDYNTVTFKVKPTDGLFTAELEMDKGNLELVETHIYEQKEEKQQESEEDVTVNTDDLVCVEMYICFGLSTIPDIFTHESQAFTVYIDGEEIQTLRRGSSSIDEKFYFSKGVHKLSIRKNNTDDFDYDSVTFTVTGFTDRLNFTISHNQLLDTFKIEKDD